MFPVFESNRLSFFVKCCGIFNIFVGGLFTHQMCKGIVRGRVKLSVLKGGGVRGGGLLHPLPGLDFLNLSYKIVHFRAYFRYIITIYSAKYLKAKAKSQV
jgi:hypothetical protein